MSDEYVLGAWEQIDSDGYLGRFSDHWERFVATVTATDLSADWEVSRFSVYVPDDRTLPSFLDEDVIGRGSSRGEYRVQAAFAAADAFLRAAGYRFPNAPVPSLAISPHCLCGHRDDGHVGDDDDEAAPVTCLAYGCRCNLYQPAARWMIRTDRGTVVSQASPVLDYTQRFPKELWLRPGEPDVAHRFFTKNDAVSWIEENARKYKHTSFQVILASQVYNLFADAVQWQEEEHEAYVIQWPKRRLPRKWAQRLRMEPGVVLGGGADDGEA